MIKKRKKTKNVHLEHTAPTSWKNESKQPTNNYINKKGDEKPKKLKDEKKSSTTRPTVQPSNQSTQSNPIKEKKEHKSKGKLQSLQEIDEAIKMLELRDSGSSKNCNCQGTRHPVFDIAPNCLHCGKVVCVIEGLNKGKCGHCHEQLISDNERTQMVEILNQEKTN